MDMHPTVTQLRETLATPDAFKTWAEANSGAVFGRNDNVSPENQTPIAHFLREHMHMPINVFSTTLSDSTHAYWWVEGHAYSLMLPDWARKIPRPTKNTSVIGNDVLAAL